MWTFVASIFLLVAVNGLPFPQSQPGPPPPPKPPGPPSSPPSPPVAPGPSIPPGLPQNVQPAGPTTPVPIISQTDVENGDGNFTFGFEAGNGIIVQERGYVKQVPAAVGAEGRAADEGADNTIQVIAGSFSYPAPDGTNISLTYIADENGFQPQGAHLPTPPPLPESVQRLLSRLSQNASDASNVPAPQASPSVNYEQVVEPTLASRSGKAIAPSTDAAPEATATKPASTTAAEISPTAAAGISTTAAAEISPAVAGSSTTAAIPPAVAAETSSAVAAKASPTVTATSETAEADSPVVNIIPAPTSPPSAR